MDEQGFIGTEIGNYRILSEINSGAFGSVYRAEHAHLKGRFVAIKLLHAFMGSPQEREQFTQEAQFLALLEHPHILPLLDFGFSGRQPYLIAKYAAGGSLRNLLKRQAPLPLEKAVTILAQVGLALSYAHQRTIIHRDLKPENILFNEQEDVLLADFGLATTLATASVKQLDIIGGTPAYMAPEQFQGHISKEGDQYALGCIAYELVTGRMPFIAPDFLSLAFKHLSEQPVPPTRYNPQVPATIEAAILKAMAKQRTGRHADVTAFIAALQTPTTPATILNSPPPSPTIQTVALPATFPTGTKQEWLTAGDAHYNANRYHEATIAYDQAIRLDPNDAQIYRNKGYALNGLQRYDEALAACDLAIRLNPNDAQAYRNKGIALNGLQRYQEAVTACDLAIRLDPQDVQAYHNKGYALTRLQRYDEALAACDLAIRLDPGDAAAYHYKAVALNKLRRYQEALAACDLAIRLNPTFAQVYRNKGDNLIALGRQREAQQAYEKAQELENNY